MDAGREGIHRTRRRTPGLAQVVRTLNDAGSGALLDALDAAGREALAPDASGEWAKETLEALASGLLERLAKVGVRRIRTAGESLELTRRQIARRFEYHGAPFAPGERRKRVIVASPGWMVGRRVAVRPVVREAAGK